MIQTCFNPSESVYGIKLRLWHLKSDEGGQTHVREDLSQAQSAPLRGPT